MSKFKSFAQQGSFRDYQIQAPDQTGKIKEETARTIRGKERAQASLERQQSLYLQAQKLAQGVEENQREQNFRLETENRKAFQDALRRDHEIQTRNDKIQAAQSAETFKQLSAFSKSAFELFGQYQELDLKRNQQENAKIAYAAGADYKTVVAIQALGDNLTKSEFAQTEFIRQKLAEGGNVDALFALYERRASKAFINNIAVAQNTAHGASIGIQLDQQKFRDEIRESEGRAPTVEEQLRRLKTYTSELSASFVGEDGRGLNAYMLNTYVYPIIRRAETSIQGNLEKDRNEEQQSIVKQSFMTSLDHAWNTGGSAGVFGELTKEGIANAANFEMFAEWVTNKSIDFGPTGLSSRDIEALKNFKFEGVNFKQTGKLTSYGESRGSLSDGAKFNQAYNARIRAEKQLTRDAAADAERKAQSNGIELYNQLAADGSISQADYEESLAQDRDSGIPGFESEGTKQMAKELDSVRFEDGYRKALTEAANTGNTERMQHLLSLKGVSYKLRQEFLPVLEKANFLTQTEEYKQAVDDIKKVITDGDERVVRGRAGSNRDHWTTNRYVAQELQAFKKQVLEFGDVSQIATLASGRITMITNRQKTSGFINEKGQYTEAISETEAQAKDFKALQLEDRQFIEGSQKPNFRKDAALAVNIYGQDDFYKDYYPMQRGEVTSQLRRRAAIMGVSPLAAINFLAGGLGQPAVAMDAQVQAIADKITPVVGRLVNKYRDSGSHDARMNQAYHIMDGTVAVAPVRGEAPNPTPRQAYDYMRALGVSDIHAKGILANIQGESGFQTGIMGDNGMSGGLFQMYNDRYRKMEAAVPDWRTNWRGQIQFALQDDTAPEYLQMDFNSPEEAADWFLENFERPAMEHRPGRRELNRSFIPQLGF